MTPPARPSRGRASFLLAANTPPPARGDAGTSRRRRTPLREPGDERRRLQAPAAPAVPEHQVQHVGGRQGAAHGGGGPGAAGACAPGPRGRGRGGAVSRHPFNRYTMEEAFATARWRKCGDVDAVRAQMETYCANGLQPWSPSKLPYPSGTKCRRRTETRDESTAALILISSCSTQRTRFMTHAVPSSDATRTTRPSKISES